MAKSYNKIKISIDGVDITDNFYLMNIYQSIDSPTWSCDIDIIDSNNLLESLPILHGSKIDIIVETNDGIQTDGNHNFIFYVYKISDKAFQNQKSETYTIKGVSKAFLENNTIRINKRFTSMKMTDMITEIANSSFSEMTVQVDAECDNSNEILVNNMNPFISIGWLLKQTHKDSRADFMFFQSENNLFRIDTISEMYSATRNAIDVIIEYKVQNIGEELMYNIISHKWDHVDVQQNLQNGFYKSTTVSYDFMNKSWAESVYSHGDDNKDDIKVAPQWKDSLFDNAEKSAVTFMPKMPKVFDSTTGYDDAEKWVPSRRAVLQRLDSEKFSAQLKGSIGMYKWLGKNIFIHLPLNEEKDNEFYSRFRMGTYVITAIVHHFTPSMYLTNFEFVKSRLEA